MASLVALRMVARRALLMGPAAEALPLFGALRPVCTVRSPRVRIHASVFVFIHGAPLWRCQK